MFTWNFQYMSKARLAETLSQLMLNAGKSDILVRIHTAIHNEEEALDLARFIKKEVPRAHIFGTTTSAVINWGRIIQNQCIISISQMMDAHIKSAIIPAFDKKTGEPLEPEKLAKNVKKQVIDDETKLMLTFITGPYTVKAESFVRVCNDVMPGVQMIGGIANTADPDFEMALDNAFVFNEKGCYHNAILAASMGGGNLEAYSSYASGAQAIGEEFEMGEQDKLRDRGEKIDLFPYVYADIDDIPIREVHAAAGGMKLRRAFIHDRKIISDNRALFRRVENFDKAESLFGYSCIARSMIYSNCAKWEVSAYENSNLCGCITGGEIVHANGVNTFANYTFVLSAVGESSSQQEYNPYVFSYTDSLSADNRELLEYLMEVDEKLESGKADEGLKSFVSECEQRILYSESEDIPNAAAMSMDIKVKGYDRICMINVPGTSSMASAFSDHIIQLTYGNYITKCERYAIEKGYKIYLLDHWHLAIGAPSYIVALDTFVKDMEVLQTELFEASEELIAIVPIICVIDGCTAENLYPVYNSARIEMMNKNIQFYVCDASAEQIDEESIRKKYHMVNVINYAIAHDKIIPYYQGIYDNKKQKIHHYESLMRLEDENGEIYYPGAFLDVARSYGLLYDSMSIIMIKKVFDKFKSHKDISVSMNIGIRDIKNKKIVEFIYDSLAAAKYPKNFIFEILESEDIDDYNELIMFVDRIHELGGKISIDDFGSGYSNLQHLISIHMDYIKIDGSIVKRCCEDKGAENLIALISAWREMSFEGVGIVAEFVENEDIQKKLMEYYIDYSQGYLFSKPAPDIITAIGK